MNAQILLVARSDTPALLQANRGVLDDGQAYRLILNTNRVAPAGVGGECIFPTLYIALRAYVAPVVLLVTVALDGKFLPVQSVGIGNGQDTGAPLELEVSLMQALIVNGVERQRYAPRGGWIEVFIDTLDSLPPALIDIGGVEVEYEVVRETRSPANASP